MKASALIPAKGFSLAKQRLSPVLSAAEREALAEAMLRDVLLQVLSVSSLEATFVVTGDKKVASVAVSFGAQAILEEEERGETEAIVFALGALKARGVEALLILPADLPLVCAADIERLLAEFSWPGPFALLVPSHDRLGTNGLLLSPPDVIELRFGYDSFKFHLNAAAAKGLVPTVVENERVALDIDEPGDLRRFLDYVDRARRPTRGRDGAERFLAGETYLRLVEMGLRERLTRSIHRLDA